MIQEEIKNLNGLKQVKINNTRISSKVLSADCEQHLSIVWQAELIIHRENLEALFSQKALGGASADSRLQINIVAQLGVSLLILLMQGS